MLDGRGSITSRFMDQIFLFRSKHVQTDYVIHPHSCSVGTGRKASKACSSPRFHISPPDSANCVYMCGWPAKWTCEKPAGGSNALGSDRPAGRMHWRFCVNCMQFVHRAVGNVNTACLDQCGKALQVRWESFRDLTLLVLLSHSFWVCVCVCVCARGGGGG